MNEMNTQLRELTELWVDATPDSLRRISALCDDMAAVAAENEFVGQIDRHLLRRAGLFSTKAEKRLAECMAIQTRTGSYSIRGAHELSPRVATAGWEG